jgi:hypothetical protein
MSLYKRKKYFNGNLDNSILAFKSILINEIIKFVYTKAYSTTL